MVYGGKAQGRRSNVSRKYWIPTWITKMRENGVPTIQREVVPPLQEERGGDRARAYHDQVLGVRGEAESRAAGLH